MVAQHLDAKFVVLGCVELLAFAVLTDHKNQPKEETSEVAMIRYLHYFR
jgi:hypothetical protein